ncbi:beta-glucan synthesis-associated protein-domain-containing protein [Papiliotrema laurentii]|uniref:Beta-glucan synthesis-associated protein-domain-containing protein n=1 Tax=Papiliotrema laurentii TaxID=5418 RepID=A0AAD9FS95_PAPLA|nr:beta-glucan synthesis-associated protein-domain-containing protein [Papiliotrema laurentii]
MFKKSSKSSSTPTDPSRTGYAFASQNAQSSSAALKKKEQETFYQPLPAPPANNPFADSAEPSRSPSPHASNPLLSHQTASAAYNNPMSAPNSRFAPQRGAQMPPRGESQRALLPDRQQSNGRRYGPTASAAPIGSNAALLNSPSQTSKEQDEMAWGGFDHNNPEADDFLHNPDPKRDRKADRGTIFTWRGLMNIGCLLVLVLCILTLFAGYPIITFYTQHHLTTNGAYNLGGINATGQVPLIANFPSPIDEDTPQNARTRTGFDGHTYNLVFSDEFNKPGRTFYPGDDPFWTAVDIHYWPTGDFEWYDPSAATTRDGNLVITMTQEPIHDLNFKSGMLQSWNQMCFQYSMYIEVRVSLPGTPAVGGFWPGVWTMGNLGRPGYGATTEGTWPYTYDSCDVGTLPNQTNVAQTGPEAALTTGSDGGVLSFLPGQRLSACTCPGEDHPGPDVSYGRATPEIDIIEAQTDLSIPRGEVSQSFQIAPFDDYYQFANTSADVEQYDLSLAHWNTYKGGTFQQAVSTLMYIDNDNYQGTSGGFGVYGFEMWADPQNRNDGYITWVASGQKSWTMHASAVGPNPRVGVGQRLIPEEPMAMILNFGMSNNFQTVNFDQLTWPAEMHIDYVRVYQRPEGKMGCDPADRPTADYIARHRNAYDNANFTTWAQAGYEFPKNSLVGC